MSITLSSELQAAQDGIVHHPIVKIISNNPVASIPFDGYKISGLTSETNAKMIMHSSGRLVYTYIYNGDPRMGYSDVGRTQWYNNNILSSESGYTCTSIDCHEMADGNIAIMLVLGADSGTNQLVQGMIYSPTGSLVSDRTTAYTVASEIDYGITLAYDGTNYRWILATG
jgi:hypothetical protein